MVRLSTKLALFVALSAGLCEAQDAAQLQKLYEDTLVQLQQSQDRKNQLANENAKLTDRIAELEAEVRSLQAAAERSQSMAMQYSAFRTFLMRYPALRAHFSQYSGAPATPERELQLITYEFYDRNWPFSAISASDGT